MKVKQRRRLQPRDGRPRPFYAVEIKRTKAGAQKGSWRYTVKGGNGEILVTGEGYTSKRDARRGLIELTWALMEWWVKQKG